MFDLSKRVALVTGAGSGIGECIAQTYAEAGAKVYVSDIDETGGARTVESILEKGGAAEFIGLDVSNADQVNDAAEKIGPLDLLVNNAGVGHVGTILQTEIADLDKMYNVNVKGVFNTSKAFLPGMIERAYGVIVNLASIGGITGVRDRLAYCMSKFAVVGITKAMALDHTHQGIRVNCICPCRIETPFVKARIAEYPDPDQAYKEMSSTQLQGRMGTPKEVAAAALYLASDEAGIVTGTALQVDGGWTAGK